MKMRDKIELRDIAVIGATALGGFLLMLITGLLAGKDVATSLLAGLLMGAPSAAVGGIVFCLLRERILDLLRRKSLREYTNAELRAYLIAGTIIWVGVGLGTFGGKQSGWLPWPPRLLSVYLVACDWYQALREFRRRRRGEAPQNPHDPEA